MAEKKYNLPQSFEELLEDIRKIETMPSVEEVVSGLSKAKSAYQKPEEGIPATDIKPGVIPDVSEFITIAVNNLMNYYLKSETYSRAEVLALFETFSRFTYNIVSELPTPDQSTMGYIYLVPIENTSEYTKWITVFDGTDYVWSPFGTTEIMLNGYVRKDDIIWITEDEYDALADKNPNKYYITYEDNGEEGE